MAATVQDEHAIAPRRTRLKRWGVKGLVLIALALLLGAGYDRAARALYGADRLAGFHLGLIHGALMPAAFPSLLLGRDVPIYAQNNVGRLYKLGYIGGINCCGFVFFGFAFSRPRSASRPKG
jgi:hypothetical protein